MKAFVIALTVIVTCLCCACEASNKIDSPGLSFEEVRAAIEKAKPGDTVVLPAGSATWTSTLTVSKAVSVIGAGKGKTNITCGFGNDYQTFLIVYQPDAASREADALFRWSGCSFFFGGRATSCFRFYQPVFYSILSKNRIDHCEFIDCQRALRIDGHFYGVMDNCDLNVAGLAMYGNNASSWAKTTAKLGGPDNFFIEDCTFTVKNRLCVTSGAGGRYCFRHNEVDVQSLYESYAYAFLDIHGSMYHGGNLGTMICEAYDNKIYANGKGVLLGDFRGGKALCYNNTVYSDRTTYAPIIREELHDGFCPPAKNVIDGSPQYPDGMYFFNNNRNNGGTITRLRGYTLNTYYENGIMMGVVDYAVGQQDPQRPGDAAYFKGPAEPYRVVPTENLDFWAERQSFDGNTAPPSWNPWNGTGTNPQLGTGYGGVGVGPLSSRPNSCSIIGAGWWDPENKKLYRWTIRGWEEYYRPYTYPHPLREM